MTMGIDTNVLVRFLTRDDEAQFARAAAVIGREAKGGRPVLISLMVLLEAEWVLRSRYELPKEEVIAAISGLLDATDVRFEDEATVEEAIHIWKDARADFADCLIGSHYRRLGCRATVTFDARALRIPGFVAA